MIYFAVKQKRNIYPLLRLLIKLNLGIKNF
jgi:hypothetical protein